MRADVAGLDRRIESLPSPGKGGKGGIEAQQKWISANDLRTRTHLCHRTRPVARVGAGGKGVRAEPVLTGNGADPTVHPRCCPRPRADYRAPLTRSGLRAGDTVLIQGVIECAARR